MGILPLDLYDGAGQFQGPVLVVFRSKRMMRESRFCQKAHTHDGYECCQLRPHCAVLLEEFRLKGFAFVIVQRIPKKLTG